MKTFGYIDDELLRSVLVYSTAERSGTTNKRLRDNLEDKEGKNSAFLPAKHIQQSPENHFRFPIWQVPFLSTFLLQRR
jgi:hypothetical protein